MKIRWLAALLAVCGTALVAAPAAQATHDDDCRPYTIETTPLDEIGVEAVIIPVNFTTSILDATAEALETTPKNPAELPVRVAAGVSAGVEYGIRLALLIMNGINAEADECRIDAHWHLMDDLLASAIRRDLGVTTTPVALFVLPESEGGYIDADGTGTKVVVREAIDALKEEGQCTCTAAESAYNQAVTALDSGSYKTAYRLFRQAYVYAFSN